MFCLHCYLVVPSGINTNITSSKSTAPRRPPALTKHDYSSTVSSLTAHTHAQIHHLGHSSAT